MYNVCLYIYVCMCVCVSFEERNRRNEYMTDKRTGGGRDFFHAVINERIDQTGKMSEMKFKLNEWNSSLCEMNIQNKDEFILWKRKIVAL